MIVPRPRALLWTCLVVVPASALATALPRAAGPALAALAAAVLLGGLDALGSGRRRRGLRVDGPAVVRLTQGRPGAVELRLAGGAGRMRVALEFPPELEAPGELLVDAALAGEAARLSWPCTPGRRGRHALRRCHVEVASALGLWGLRTVLPLATEVRVYPSLAAERGRLANLFLRRGGLGVHAQRQIGRGREFEKLREYVPGDPYEDVDWKATARRGRPVTRVHRVERTQQVYAVLDASRLSARSLGPGATPAGTTVLERFITASLVLGLAAERQGDLFGLVTFADRVRGFVGARSGRAHFGACRDALFALEPRIEAPDLDDVFATLALKLRRRALLVFFTSLDDPCLAESFLRNVVLLRRRHLVLVAMVRPPGVQPAFSNPEVTGAGDLYGELAGHLRWAELREVGARLERGGAGFGLFEAGELAAGVVGRYAAAKQRQLL